MKLFCYASKRLFLVLLLALWAGLAAGEQTLVKNQDVLLWTESFGNSKNPAVLLMSGAGQSADYWPESFCKELSEHGYFVIRYDHRDTGQSTFVDFKKNPYDLNTMTQDALTVLDYYQIPKAHVVGFSLGGYIAQIIGFEHADRALSLTLIATTANHSPLMAAFQGQLTDSELPTPDPVVLATIHQLMQKTPKDEQEKVKLLVDFTKLIHGTGEFDEEYWHTIHQQAVKRETQHDVQGNHILAQASHLEDRGSWLKQIQLPVVIIQGTADPFFPQPHAQYMKKALPNSELVEIEGMGHALDPQYLPAIKKTLYKMWDSTS